MDRKAGDRVSGRQGAGEVVTGERILLDTAVRDLVLETPRLVLRLYRESDYPVMCALSAEPSMWTYSERGPMMPDEAWTRLLRSCGHWALLGYGLFAIEDKATGDFIGEAGCSDFRRQLGPRFDGAPEISWAILPAHQGRGYAAEAALAALDWIEGARRPERTVCLIHRDNQPSLRVAERLGYAQSGAQNYRGYPAVLLHRPLGGKWPAQM